LPSVDAVAAFLASTIGRVSCSLVVFKLARSPVCLSTPWSMRSDGLNDRVSSWLSCATTKMSETEAAVSASSGRVYARHLKSFWITKTGVRCDVRGGLTDYNSLQHTRTEVEPMAGIEPATDGLRNRCSTTELHWLSMQVLEKAGESIRAGIGVVKRLARGFRVYGASG
jgi:hypothetical protein